MKATTDNQHQLRTSSWDGYRKLQRIGVIVFLSFIPYGMIVALVCQLLELSDLAGSSVLSFHMRLCFSW